MEYLNFMVVSEILNETDNVIFILDKKMKIVNVNDMVIQSLGYSNEYLRGKELPHLSWDLERQVTKQHLIHLLRHPDEKRNFFFVDKDGELRHFTLKIKKIKNFYIVVGRDTTDNLLMKHNELIEENKFNTLFHNPGVGNVIVDLDLTYAESNQTFVKMIGYSKGNLLKMSPLDITKEEDIEETKKAYNDLLKGNKTYVQQEKRYRTKMGTIIWVLIVTTLHTSDNGDPIYFMSTVQDITDKKIFEEHTRMSSKKYKILFNKSFQAIAYKKVIYGINGDVSDYLILDANDTYAKVTGFKREEIINRPMKIKAQKHFGVSAKENMKRLERYDFILKQGMDVHFKKQPSRTFDELIDVYYYILDKSKDTLAVVFGDVSNRSDISSL